MSRPTQSELSADLISLKQMVDNRVPECGEEDCDTCKTRHIYLAKDFKKLLDQALQAQLATETKGEQ